MMAMVRVDISATKVRLRGRVTGVGFRWSALAVASRHPGLRGWVCNVAEGEVESVLAGSATEVAAMLAWLRHGPPGALIQECEVTTVALALDPGVFHVR